MPLRPNLLERFAISWGMVPWPLLDVGMSGFMFSAFIGAGEVDLFKKMNEGPANLQQLAQKTGCNERALQNLLNVLEPLGYVKRKGKQYELTKEAQKTVPIDTFHEMIPYFKKQEMLNIENAGRALREVPEEGVIGWERVQEGKFGRSYQVAMRWLAGSTVEEVTKKISLPKGAKRMIDIGGSHGLYCVEMCKRHPELKATVLDWPIGIENAQETLREEPEVAGRIDTHAADFHEDELPEGYDFAFLGNIIHGNRPEQNRKLFKKISAATTDSAKIGILDQFDNISGSSFTKAVSALAGWALFLFANGRAYDIAQVRDWLNEAGFSNLKTHGLRSSPGFTLLVAEK